MKLYNTLTRTVRTIKPLDEKTYGVYSCGPTVYDHAHIGNLSAYIFADTLRRTLEISGRKENISTKHVMNYTDVDDKTIRRSRELYPDDKPAVALQKLTDKYIELFLEDMRTIGNATEPITFVRATESIDSMQALIRKLYSQGFAYIADDGVYFSIDAYRKSGKQYGQLLDLSVESTSEARINNDEYDKENVHDFALWKAAKSDEPSWDFEIDGQDISGRPGWHIECSAMSEDTLGLPFDIHTGGVDLIFPHHENEIAQSTATQENPLMAQFFTHNEHILVDGKKMSKSAHNFFTLKDIIDRGYDPLAFRLLVLQSRYRNSTNLTWDGLGAAQNRLDGYREISSFMYGQAKLSNDSTELTPLDIEGFASEILQALEDDLDTPKALTIMSRLKDDVLQFGISMDAVDDFRALLKSIDELLGLSLAEVKDISAEQKQVIKNREEARKNKDWTTSDKLRDELTEQGVGLRDTEFGTIWRRLS